MTEPEPSASPRAAERLTPGTLYVVATPIGNLRDVSLRARDVLAAADVIAAEDTRHTGTLLKALGVHAKELIAVHEHNESARSVELIRRLKSGATIALVSDAGTPLISDPGFNLVRAAAEADVPVVAVPGACAAIAALSIAGLPTDRFVFEGFLPAKTQARRERLLAIKAESRTVVLYEAPHRVVELLSDVSEVLGPERALVIARELTKLYESTYRGSASALLDRAKAEPDMSRGEVVVVVGGASADVAQIPADVERTLNVLLDDLSPAQAAKIAAKLTGAKRSELYELAMGKKGGG